VKVLFKTTEMKITNLYLKKRFVILHFSANKPFAHSAQPEGSFDDGDSPSCSKWETFTDESHNTLKDISNHLS